MGCWPRGRGISRIRGGTEEGGGEGEEGGRSFLTLELAVRQSTALSRSVSLRQQRQSSLHARSLCWTRRRGDGLVTISVPPSFGTVERDKPPCRTCLLSFLHLAGSDGDARLDAILERLLLPRTHTTSRLLRPSRIPRRPATTSTAAVQGQAVRATVFRSQGGEKGTQSPVVQSSYVPHFVLRRPARRAG
ncbi:hypothetical protein BJY59DRAFT_535453 [Rhodotorula toruloides]